MGLQLRMTHSLGQRLVEVESRSVDNPIVVGRGADAQVQIPSANIARKHCLLFVHEGRWVVQDANSPGGTFLNGERISEPAFINSGDVIKLGGGSGPPSLLVDPHSVGVSEGVDDAAPAPVTRTAAPTPAQPPRMASRPTVPSSPMPPPLIPQPASAPAAPGFIEGEENDNIFGTPAPLVPAYAQGSTYPAQGLVPGYQPQAPAVDPWGAPAAATPAKPRPRRVVKQQGISPTTFAVVAAVSLVIMIIGGVWIYNNYRKADEASRPKETAEHPAEQQKQPNSIFDFQPPAKGTKTGAADNTHAAPGVQPAPDRRGTARAAPKTQPAPIPPAAATSVKPEMDVAAEKAVDDPEWDAVERARSSGDPVIAIVKFGDYMDRFPENKNKKDIERYTDEALDLLWWKRLNDLFAERNEAQKQIASRKMEISQAQDPNFKKDLEKEIARFTETRDNVDSVIHDQMKFTSDTPPNLYDSQDLSIARKSRDPKYYEETWKPQVLKTIKASHGQRLPWRNSQ